MVIKCALKLFFKAINNVAEYGVLVRGLDLDKEIKRKELSAFNDF